ncbi:hypothetical protein [Mariniplasma anaerobium]|uniref:Rho termination factor N-terminal domain-containing protein n=1 Tax=Mariniplasma anaerobium TaxID=2735436 RepID=A0A7U9XV13_9MOLU|nr:hypothetical protein [Mariniplasma anaerobium]BCR35663.1 hypothetical protein MPAN_005560 [Mariniplasma anaerobium]
MPRLTRESKIAVGNKEYKIEDLLKTIIYLPQTEIKSYFVELGLTIPRELRIYVLKENLRLTVVETRKSRLTMADEINYRLSWFTEFSEIQLENLMVFFNDERIFRNFLEDFWTDLLGYMVEKEVSAKELRRLYDLSVTHVKKNGLALPNIKTYNRDLKDIFYDSFGRIDGLPLQKLRPVLYKSSTLTEIRDLGAKYGVNVPRRLKKNELADIIVNELKENDKYTDELDKKVHSMSVIVMQRFAIDNDIKASTELKKEEIIEYILKNAKETKESYFIPTSLKDYEKEVHDVSQEVIEEAVQKKVEEVVEDIVEEVIEEAVEEQLEPEEVIVEDVIVEEEIKPVEEKIEEVIKPQVQYVQGPSNLDALVDEIRKLREVIEQTSVKEKVEVKEEAIEIKEEPETHVVETELDDTDQEAIVLNSAEFYGDKKDYKKLHKKDEADEREAFIEQRKEEVASGEGSNDEKLPGELRFFGKVFKGFGLLLFKILRKLLKIVLIIAVIAAVVLILYGLLTYYVTTLTFLDGFNNTLNGLLQIGGRGLLDFIHYLFSSIGM